MKETVEPIEFTRRRPANFVERFVKAFTKAAPLFSGWGGGPWWGRIQPSRALPGERDWSKIIGDGTGSSIVEACVLWMCRNLPEAPLVVIDEGGEEDVPQIVRGHELPKQLKRPNPFYSGTLLWYGLLTSFIADGNAYAIKARDPLDRVREWWYVPHWMLEPRWPQDGRTYISHYDYTPDGRIQQIDPRDVYHLRYGLDPENTRKGRSPLRTLFRELGVDEEASRFSASILHKLGVPGVVWWPEKGSKKTIEEPERLSMKAKFNEEFGGDNRGSLMVMSRPGELVQFGFNPKEMDLGAIRDIPEERVTAVLGIPAAVVGFGTGLQTAKVGATMSELRDQAYENCVIPTQRLIADELTVQALPDYASESEIDRLSVGWDLSKVRVLQEAQGKLAERMSTLVRSHVIEIAEARAATGFPVRPTDHVFAPSPGVELFKPDGTPVIDPAAAAAAALPSPQMLALQDGTQRTQKAVEDLEKKVDTLTNALSEAKHAKPTDLGFRILKDESGRFEGIERKVMGGN